MTIRITGDGGPVYEQIARQVRESVERGVLLPGAQLPTVRELAQQLSIARGTVKHAYDRLHQQGIVTMAPGRGTFVLETAAPQGKKDRAMAAISRTLDELEALGFSPREMEIFFTLKLREREQQGDPVRLLLIECNPESLLLMGRRLSAIPGVEIDQMQLEEALKAGAGYARQADLVVTTATHYSQVQLTVENQRKVIQIVLAPSRETLLSLAKAGEHRRLGILCASEVFARLIGATLRECGVETAPQVMLFAQGDVEPFLADKEVLILPQEYLWYCTPPQREAVDSFVAAGRPVVEFNYQIDEGSFLRLQERIESVQRSRMG